MDRSGSMHEHSQTLCPAKTQGISMTGRGVRVALVLTSLFWCGKTVKSGASQKLCRATRCFFALWAWPLWVDLLASETKPLVELLLGKGVDPGCFCSQCRTLRLAGMSRGMAGLQRKGLASELIRAWALLPRYASRRSCPKGGWTTILASCWLPWQGEKHLL